MWCTLERQSAKNFRVQGIFYLSANEEGVCGDNGNYCPVDCHCQESVVKCERKGLFEFPAGIPSDTTHLSLIHNQISVIPKREINRLHNLVKLLAVEAINYRKEFFKFSQLSASASSNPPLLDKYVFLI